MNKEQEERKNMLTDILQETNILQIRLLNYFQKYDILKDSDKLTKPSNYLMVTIYNCMQSLLLSAGSKDIKKLHSLNVAAIHLISNIEIPEGVTYQ